MNAKYVESLEEVLQLENSFPKKLPIPADGGRAINSQKGAGTPLTPEDHHLYRKGVGMLLYLAPERPDLMFALKKLSMKLASPTEGDLELLRFVGKYLRKDALKYTFCTRHRIQDVVSKRRETEVTSQYEIVTFTLKRVWWRYAQTQTGQRIEKPARVYHVVP